MIYKFTSIKEIIEGVYRDTAIHEELDIWDVIEWRSSRTNRCRTTI